MTDIWDVLDQPAEIAGLALKNRYVMAPMTRAHSPGGVPTTEVAQYYERRARSLGMIITEGTYVDHPSAGQSDAIPRLDSAGAHDGWKKVVRDVHATGGTMFSQLWHIGGMRRAGDQPFPDAPVFTPSGVALSGKSIGEAPAASGIVEVIDAFARSAAAASQIGFDGVEIHGAHGYLIDQFLWEGTNKRTDQYGGSLQERVRMARDVVAAVRDSVGPNYPIQFRFSQWKAGRWDEKIAETPQQLEHILLPLKDAGVDIFHPSTRRYWLPGFAGSDLTLAGWTKKITGVPTVLVGHVGVETSFGDGVAAEVPQAARLEELYARGEFDLLALGRALLADPQWVIKTRDGRADDITHYTKASEEVYY